MKYKPPPKRTKLDAASSTSSAPSTNISPPLERRDVVSSVVNKTANFQVCNAQTDSSNMRIRQARDFAVAQAQQDGCKSNFRVFDSSFGNYLVPVIPNRSELGG